MPKKTPGRPDEQNRRKAQKHRDDMAAKSREEYRSVAEIGELPAVVKPKRRESCRNDLLKFLVTYFPETTGLAPFSDDHCRVIQRLEQSAIKGGRFYNLVYRGFAKTTISVNTAIWALLYGHRKYVLLVAATKPDAAELLDAIKSELESNELLAEDFPEVCHAIEALDGKPQRCNSQTHQGERTRIEWKKDKVVFPTILDSKGEPTPGSGATIVCRGMLGAIRGRGKRNRGKQLRPDWVIVDDPQTDFSAASPGQVKKRLGVLSKTILKLAGHNHTIAVIVNGTIIEPNDFMDRLRDPNLYSGWQGETVKMVRDWAEAHETLWLGDYARIRRSFDASDPADRLRAHREANAFYLAHRAEMDLGCVVSWEHCYDHELEHSAIQHAYNFLIDDGEDVFAAECQSEPIKADEGEQLTLADIIHKLSGYAEGEVPGKAVKLTAFIDCQHESLWWTVIAWTAEFTGYVIGYGVWPQPIRLDGITKKNLRETLSKKYTDQRDPQVRLRVGLTDLADELLGRDWKDCEGRPHRISVCFVDQQEGTFSKAIRAWAQSSPWSSIVRPFMGQGVGPGDEPMPSRPKKDGEVRRGLYWIEERDKDIRGGTITKVDKNWWNTFIASRWRAGSPRPKNSDTSLRPCEPGALYLWGDDPHRHGTFAHHQLAEWGDTIKHEKSGRSVEMWKHKPGKPDNEFWDGVSACAAGADYTGAVSLKGAGLKSTSKRRHRRTREELQKLKEARYGR